MLSDYAVGPQIGTSSADGFVHHAKRNTDGIDVAIKFNSNNAPTSSARFTKENDILYKLEPHQGIIKPFSHIQRDNFQGSDMDFYAMEFTQTSLGDRMFSTAARDVDAQLSIFKQVCEALKYAHSKGYIHRDLHWQNVLMNVLPSEQIKLIDFGRAYDFSNLTRISDETPFWGDLVMPPEVRFGTLDDPDLDEYVKGDVFALGVIWKMLFQRNLEPFYDMKVIIAEIERYIVSNLPSTFSVSDYYISVPIGIRQALYSDWLNSEAYKFNGYYDIRLSDVDLGDRITAVSKALLCFDASQRSETVDDVLNMLTGVQ